MSEERKGTLEMVAEPEPKMPPYGLTAREWFEFRAKLAKKKLAVMAAVDTIPKNGYNAEDDYWFARESDINDSMRKLLNDHGLGFDVEFIERNLRDNGKIIEVKLLITWTDVDTGYFESRKWLAAGFDYVEKGVYKAYTGGAKYFIMRTFLMSQGDTDPEHSDKKKDKPTDTTIGATTGVTTEATKDPLATEDPRTSGRGNRKTQVEPSAKETNNKQADEPQQAATTSQEQPESEATEGDTKPEQTGKVTSDQVGEIKKHVLTLAAFSDDKNKKAAQDAVYQSLTIKPEMREWGARVKGAKSHGDMIAALTEREAAKAIEYLSGWVDMKQKQKQKGSVVDA